ncbi:MAG: hypothetical protein WDN24_20820 [Sphingomonas sp.]
MTITLNVNGADHEVDADPATPLLYVLRDDLGSTAPNMAVAWANAAPARCSSTARRSIPA